MFMSKCLLNVQNYNFNISQGLGPFFQIELWKTGRILTREFHFFTICPNSRIKPGQEVSKFRGLWGGTRAYKGVREGLALHLERV